MITVDNDKNRPSEDYFYFFIALIVLEIFKPKFSLHFWNGHCICEKILNMSLCQVYFSICKRKEPRFLVNMLIVTV